MLLSSLPSQLASILSSSKNLCKFTLAITCYYARWWLGGLRSRYVWAIRPDLLPWLHCICIYLGYPDLLDICTTQYTANEIGITTETLCVLNVLIPSIKWLRAVETEGENMPEGCQSEIIIMKANELIKTQKSDGCGGKVLSKKKTINKVFQSILLCHW